MDLREPVEPFDPQRDPVLQRALTQLRVTQDQREAQLSLNIIKIIVEHQMEVYESLAVKQAGSAVLYWRLWEHERQYRHCCTLHDTIHSSLQLLNDSPEDLQIMLIPGIAQLVAEALEVPN
jgi:hypothetical protein